MEQVLLLVEASNLPKFIPENLASDRSSVAVAQNWATVNIPNGISSLEAKLGWDCMPVDTAQLKQRMKQVLDAKLEVIRLTSKPYEPLNTEEKFAIRYHIIVLAEAVGSTCLHIAAEDIDLKPQSYSECFKIMEERKICVNCAKDLTSIIRLRNLLTHQYWKIEDRQVYDSVKDDFKSVDKFLQSVKQKYAASL